MKKASGNSLLHEFLLQTFSVKYIKNKYGNQYCEKVRQSVIQMNLNRMMAVCVMIAVFELITLPYYVFSGYYKSIGRICYINIISQLFLLVCSVICGLRAFHIRTKAEIRHNNVLRLYLCYYFFLSIGMLFYIYSDIKRGDISNTIYYLAVIFSTFPIFTFKEALFYIAVNTGGVFGIMSCVGESTFFENIQVIFIFVASWAVLFHLRATTYKILYNQCSQEELNRKLDSLSKIDPLTNLPNRRALDEYVKEKLSLWKQNKSKVMVLMVDIDNFKNYNDTFSHLDGDDCLNAVAGAVIEKLEDYKKGNYILARIGGEEFMVLLENWETEKEILDVCIQMKKSVEDMHLVAGNGSLHEFVTISIGCSVFDPQDIRAEGENPVEAQYRFADYELYNAKNNGKNRISYRGKIIAQLSEVG